MWSDSPRQPKKSADDERSYSRMLCCLQNTRWVWLVWNAFLLLESIIGATQDGQFYPEVVYKVQNFMILCTKQFARHKHVEKNV